MPPSTASTPGAWRRYAPAHARAVRVSLAAFATVWALDFALGIDYARDVDVDAAAGGFRSGTGGRKNTAAWSWRRLLRNVLFPFAIPFFLVFRGQAERWREWALMAHEIPRGDGEEMAAAAAEEESSVQVERWRRAEESLCASEVCHHEEEEGSGGGHDGRGGHAHLHSVAGSRLSGRKKKAGVQLGIHAPFHAHDADSLPEVLESADHREGLKVAHQLALERAQAMQCLPRLRAAWNVTADVPLLRLPMWIKARKFGISVRDVEWDVSDHYANSGAIGGSAFQHAKVHVTIVSQPEMAPKSRKRSQDDNAEKNSRKCVLHFPGGGMLAMNPTSHLSYLLAWTRDVPGVPIVSVNYLKAPEFPFPMAVDQAFAVLRALHHDPVVQRDLFGTVLSDEEKLDVVITGDSAGGNLASVTTLQAVRDALAYEEEEEEGMRAPAVPVPVSCVLTYPWTTENCASRKTFGDDIILPYSLSSIVGPLYFATLIAEEEARHHLLKSRWRAFPAEAPAELLRLLPPTQVIVGDCDPLLDDAKAFAGAAEKAGAASVECRIVPGISHGFLSMDKVCPASRDAVRQVGTWISDGFTH